jgi:hypothetical protein
MRGLASGFLIPRGSLDGDKVSGDLFGCVQNAITIVNSKHTIRFRGQTNGHGMQNRKRLNTELLRDTGSIMVIFRYAEYSEGDPNSRGYVFLE